METPLADLARSPQQLGALIRRHREQKGLTQTDLARRIGARQATISVVETGGTGTKLSTLLDILAALDLELTLAARSRAAASIEDIF